MPKLGFAAAGAAATGALDLLQPAAVASTAASNGAHIKRNAVFVARMFFPCFAMEVAGRYSGSVCTLRANGAVALGPRDFSPTELSSAPERPKEAVGRLIYIAMPTIGFLGSDPILNMAQGRLHHGDAWCD